MSVVVKHLNADSTFLLIFSPDENPTPADVTSANGAYTVLIDPWLVGPSIITAPWFAKTERRIPSAIQHLSEIEQPDVLVISQNKPDHCHKETLLQLRPDGKTIIIAEPSAAKTIKSWHHFDPSRVRGVLKYDPRFLSGRSVRLRIPPLSPLGIPGELDIAFIPAKSYMTGLHNAFGITYQPPTQTKAFGPVATVDLPRPTRYFHMPLTPLTMPPSSPPPPMSPPAARPMSFDAHDRDHVPMLSPRLSQVRGHRPRLSQKWNTFSPESLTASNKPIVKVDPKPDTEEIVERIVTIPGQAPYQDSSTRLDLEPAPFSFAHTLPTPPDSPGTMARSSAAPMAVSSTSTVSGHDPQSSISLPQKSLASPASTSSLSPVTPARPKAISIIYAPHGLPLADLQPYIQNHLVRLPGALPLTLLLHSFDHAQNPWYLGGNIMTGVQGGAEIARALMVRCWISAHDEPKDDRGFSVKQLRVKRGTADEAKQRLLEGEHGQSSGERGWTCDVRSLDVGKEIVVASASQSHMLEPPTEVSR